MFSNATIPKDPVMLLSFINTQLRDHYPSLAELCASLGIDEASIVEKLGAIDYTYNENKNQFQ